jgi:hypothetical protein
MLFKHLTFAISILVAGFFKGTLANRGNPAPCGAPFCAGAANMDAMPKDDHATPTSTAVATLPLRV